MLIWNLEGTHTDADAYAHEHALIQLIEAIVLLNVAFITFILSLDMSKVRQNKNE